jgi:hypothetical protein
MFYIGNTLTPQRIACSAIAIRAVVCPIDHIIV